MGGLLDFFRQGRVRITREMLRDYFIQLRSQGPEYFVQQGLSGGFPRRHKSVREVFKQLKRTMIRQLARSRTECGGIR